MIDKISLDNIDYRHKYAVKIEQVDEDTKHIHLYRKGDNRYWGTLIRKSGKIINPHKSNTH